MSPGDGPGSPHITLTVKSTSGSFSEDFNRNNKAQKSSTKRSAASD